MYLELGLPLSQDWPSASHYQNRDFILHYTAIVAQVIDQLPNGTVPFDGPNANQPRLSNANIAEAIITSDAEIANATLTDHGVGYEPLAHDTFFVAELQELLTEIDIHVLLTNLGIDIVPEKIVVKSKNYLRSISTFIKACDSRLLSAYLSWKLIQSFYSYVETEATRPLQSHLPELASQDPSYD